MKNTIPTEAQEQQAFYQWFQLFAKGLDAEFLFIPNENKAPVQYQVKAKRMGRQKGTPDVFISFARLGFHGLFVEMKAKKGRLEDSQKQMHERLRKCGYCVRVCYGAEQAIEVTREYMLGDGKFFEENKN